MPDRAEELTARLASVRDRIERACGAAGRDPAEVHLIAITKTYPADDVLRLAELGVIDVGENRDQEAAAKAEAVAAAGVRVRWHFVGHLQRNKARSVVGYAGAVHSVDSVRLAEALDRAASSASVRLDALIQVSLDGDPERGGAVDADVTRIGDRLAASEALRLRGVMAVAPMDWEPDRAFARLREVAEQVRSAHPGATWISAGMSGDLESAVKYGSTHVRVGSALLGNRPPLR